MHETTAHRKQADRGPFPLAPGEDPLLKAQGAVRVGARCGWKLGQLCLTSKRLVFSTPSAVALDVPLPAVDSLVVEKQKFVLCSKPAIRVRYDMPPGYSGSPRTQAAWIITQELQRWWKKLYEMTQLCVDEKSLTTLAAKLDPLAARLLWHVWHNGYTNLEELMQLLGADSHSEVLLKIKGEINPAAEQLLGVPILDFRKRATDTTTGKTVLFSWWIAGREKGVRNLLPERPGGCCAQKVPDTFFPPIDLFDEDDHVDVVVELPGARPEDVRASVESCGVEDTRLVLHAAVSDFTVNGREIHEQIPLPGAIQADAVDWKLNNGVLHVRLPRPSAPNAPQRRTRNDTDLSGKERTGGTNVRE